MYEVFTDFKEPSSASTLFNIDFAYKTYTNTHSRVCVYKHRDHVTQSELKGVLLV